MLIRPTVFFVLVSALWLALAGCGTPTPPEIKAVGSATVTVDATNRRTSARVALANEVTLVLPPANPAGYVWQISAHDSRFLKQRTEITADADPEKGSTVAFLALRLGLTRIRFVLVKSAGQREIDPVDFREVELTIQ